MLDEAIQEVEVEEAEAVEVEAEEEGVELETEAETEEVEEEAAETDGESDEEDGEEEAGAAALTVTIEGEEEEPEDASEGIRNLRQAHKEQKKRIKELEEQLKAREAPEAELGEKPTLEGFDYDAEKFEAALIDWNERKRAHDAQKAQKEREEQEAREQYGKKLQAYQAKKVGLGAKDFDEAEEAVLENLSVQQQSVIIANSEKPELVVYALGKNPKVMERLSSKKDLISFAFELAKLENNLKVTGTAKPKPEKRVKGAAGAALTTDKKLAQLEAEAERTGDMTKLIRYKKELRNRKANK